MKRYVIERDLPGVGKMMRDTEMQVDEGEIGLTALEFRLLASRGSDFHSPGESRTELGALPDLPGRLAPVWSALRHRMHGRLPFGTAGGTATEAMSAG